jgi:hypothetical protein
MDMESEVVNLILCPLEGRGVSTSPPRLGTVDKTDYIPLGKTEIFSSALSVIRDAMLYRELLNGIYIYLKKFGDFFG